MVAERIKAVRLEPQWSPEVPVYENTVSKESPSWRACQLWKEKLGEYAELARDDFAVVYTGIGGAVAGRVGHNGVKDFGDGSVVYPKPELPKNKDGKVPGVVFLVASAVRSEELTNLITLADEYKEEGVQIVIFVLTGFPHERQDHEFKSGDQGINQLTTLKGVVDILAGVQKIGLVDGVVAVGNHSQRAGELASRRDLPLLLIDTFEFMVQSAELDEIERPIVLGPDKGRYDIAARLAARLQCPVANVEKVRDRLNAGDPNVTLSPKVLDFIKVMNRTVVVLDDECREAGTAAAIRELVNGYAERLVMVFLKAFLAPCSNHTETAITRLGKTLNPDFVSERIFFANAVDPILDPCPISGKTTWLDMGPELEKMIGYLAKNLDKPAGPNEDGIYPESLFSVDLHRETYD